MMMMILMSSIMIDGSLGGVDHDRVVTDLDRAALALQQTIPQHTPVAAATLFFPEGHPANDNCRFSHLMQDMNTMFTEEMSIIFILIHYYPFKI